MSLTRGKYGRRIEIDNVIAYVGAERFWNEFILTIFTELFKTANYNLSLKKTEYVMQRVERKEISGATIRIT